MIKKDEKYKQNIVQLIVISISIWLFCLESILSVFWEKVTRGFMFYFMGIIIFALLALYLILFIKKIRERKALFFSIRQLIDRNKYLFITLFISMVARLPQVNTIVRNDCTQYYSEIVKICSNFELSFNYILQNFRLAAHPAYGVVYLFSILEFMNPADFHNVWGYQTFLSLITVGCVFCLLRHVFTEINQKYILFLTLIFSFSSMFLGMDTYFTSDFSVACFLVWVICSVVFGRNIYLIFSSILLVSSRELGIVLLCGVFAANIIYIWISESKQKISQRIVKIWKDKTDRIFAVIILASGICLFLDIFYDALVMNASIQPSYTQGYGTIGFNPTFILGKIKGYICTNFVWLYLLLAIGIVILFICRKIKLRFEELRLLLMAVCAAGLYGIVLAMFITYQILRYQIAIEMLLSFFCIVLIACAEKYLNHKVVWGIIALALSLLVFVQAYLTIDPVMRHEYQNLDTGEVPIIVTRDSDVAWVGDYCIYNYQYTYIDNCLRKVLRNVNYTGDYDILNFGIDAGLKWGNGYYWNVKKQDFSMKSGEDTVAITRFSNETCASMQGALPYEKMKDHVIIIESKVYPYNEDEMNQFLEKYYTNIEQHRVNDGLAGQLTYLTADKK